MSWPSMSRSGPTPPLASLHHQLRSDKNWSVVLSRKSYRPRNLGASAGACPKTGVLLSRATVKKRARRRREENTSRDSRFFNSDRRFISKISQRDCSTLSMLSRHLIFAFGEIRKASRAGRVRSSKSLRDLNLCLCYVFACASQID